jgi:hypothetical protein
MKAFINVFRGKHLSETANINTLGWIRTSGLLLRRQTLYPLSYERSIPNVKQRSAPEGRTSIFLQSRMLKNAVL